MITKILLTSTDSIQIEAVTLFFNQLTKTEINLTTLDCSECNFPVQPYTDYNNSGHYVTKAKLNYAMTKLKFNEYDYIVSIENMLQQPYHYSYYIAIMHQDIIVYGGSITLYVPCIEKIYEHTLIRKTPKIYGYQLTIGEMLQTNDWLEQYHQLNRAGLIQLIQSGLMHTYKQFDDIQSLKEKLLSSLKIDRDPDTLFPVFEDPPLETMMDFIADNYRFDEIDLIVGLREGHIAHMVASKLGIEFVPILKQLPGDKYQIQFMNGEGKRVLVIDNLMIIEESIPAAIRLVSTLGFTMIDCLMLRNTPEVKEISTLIPHCSILLWE